MADKESDEAREKPELNADQGAIAKVPNVIQDSLRPMRHPWEERQHDLADNIQFNPCFDRVLNRGGEDAAPPLRIADGPCLSRCPDDPVVLETFNQSLKTDVPAFLREMIRFCRLAQHGIDYLKESAAFYFPHFHQEFVQLVEDVQMRRIPAGILAPFLSAIANKLENGVPINCCQEDEGKRKNQMDDLPEDKDEDDVLIKVEVKNLRSCTQTTNTF